MRRTAALALVIVCLTPALSRADIFEIKGEGYINGKVVSEDEKEITIKDGHGDVRKLRKSDVIYMEKEAPKKSVPIADQWRQAKEAVKKKIEKVAPGLKSLTAPVHRAENKQMNEFLNETTKQANDAIAQRQYMDKKAKEENG